jgi:glyceraldehyde-3-phosphate dehydrogenase (NADP+)
MNQKPIPEKFKIEPHHCNEYLINGELRKWEGNTAEVFSVIKTSNKQGKISPTFFRNCP